MKRTFVILLLGLLATRVGLEVSPQPASAQTGGGFELTWFTIDSGGHMSSAGGGFMLSGTVGQPDAGAALIGAGFTLTGGFWGEAPTALTDLAKLFLPLIRR